MNAEVDFASRLHNVQGDLISERTKNFRKLLLSSDIIPKPEELDQALIAFKPKNYLESLFKVDALIHFRKTPALLEILKGGNDIFVSKIVKQQWFIEEAFRDVEAEKIVNEFFPCVSYGLRMKLINRIARNWSEVKTNDLYDQLMIRYGLLISNVILHSCTSDKIKEILRKYEIKLKPNQVLFLFDKDVDLFVAYLCYFKDIFGEIYAERKVANYVASRNPNLLLDLREKNLLHISEISRQATKKFYVLVEEDVLKDFNKYINFLKKPVLMRKLGRKFEDIFKRSFPKRIEDITMYSNPINHLNLYNKNKRWQLFYSAFAEIFPNEQISILYLNLSDSLLHLNPEKNIIYAWAEANYKESNYDKWLTFYEPTKGIKLIKEKINVTSDIYNRTSLISFLFDSCEQNKDLDALEEVLKYTCLRHRNEQLSVKRQILDKILHSHLLDRLTENHWNYIYEHIKIIRLETDEHLLRMLEEEYLIFLFKNDKPFDEAIVNFLKNLKAGNRCNLLMKNSEAKAKILKELIIKYPEILELNIDNIRDIITDTLDCNKEKGKCVLDINEFPYLIPYIENIFNDTDNLNSEKVSIMGNTIVYNTEYPQNAIYIAEAKIINVILSLLDTEYDFPANVFKIMLCKSNRTVFENNMLKLYFDRIFNKYGNQYDHLEIIFWFIKHEPTTIQPFFEKLNFTAHRFESKAIKLLKCYSHFNFDVILRNRLQTSLDILDKTDYSSIGKVVKYLGILQPTDDFIELINKRYLPKKVKLDLKDKEMMDSYRVQCEVAKTLHIVTEPAKMLPVVLKFCIGDYLQSVLPAMYSLIYKSPEKDIFTCVDFLSKQAISVRKHALFLSCQLLDVKSVLTLLKSTKRSDVSSNKHLFTSTFNYFRRNQSEETFNLVVNNLDAIDKNDTETLDSLKNVKIPAKYKTKYIECCWEFYESLEKQEVNYIPYLNGLVTHLLSSENILKSCSQIFIKKIINNYFKERKELTGVTDLIIDILQYRKSEQTENCKTVFEIAARFEYNCISHFFKSFHKKIYKSMDRDFCELFSKNWYDYFPMEDTFLEYIKLKFIVFYVTRNSLESYARNVVTYLDELSTQYGSQVLNVFMGILRDELNTQLYSQFNKYDFFLHMLQLKSTPDIGFLVLKCIDTYDSQEEHLKETYHKVLDIIRNIEDPLVRISYKYFVMGHNLY